MRNRKSEQMDSLRDADSHLTNQTPLRAVIWAAVSSKPQADDLKMSLKDQVAEGLAFAERHGMKVVKTIEWRGYSRRESDVISALEDFAKQKMFGYQELRSLWQKKAFDVLICFNDGRLGRSFPLYTWVVANVINSGARIYRLQGGWIQPNEATYQMAIGGIAATSDIDRLVKGRNSAMYDFARRGLPTSSHVLMSHKLIRSKTGDPLHLEVDDTKWRLWKDLATLLIEGVSWSLMEQELFTRYGHAGPGNKPFSPHRMYSILNTFTFWGNSARFHRRDGLEVGDYVFSEDEGIKAGGVRRDDGGYTLPNGTVVYYNTHPGVYQDDLRDKVIANIKWRRGLGGRARPHNTNRFTGLFICGGCGYTMPVFHKETYWGVGCSSPWTNARTQVDCPERKYVNDHYIVEYIQSRFNEMFAADDFRAFMGLTETMVNFDQDITAVEQEIETHSKQRRNLIRKQMDLDEDEDDDPYRDEIKVVGEQLKVLKNRLDTLQQNRIAQSAGGADQQQAFEDIKALGDAFWELPSPEINQLLRRLLGDKRFVVLGGKITHYATRPHGPKDKSPHA